MNFVNYQRKAMRSHKARRCVKAGGKRVKLHSLPDATKPIVVFPAPGDVSVAERNANAPGIVSPTPATQPAEPTARRPGGVLRGAAPVVVFIVPVVHPLPNVSQ